ncbi:ABC transporter permease [Caproiciproducens galactitolivorans]|uniref:Transport permease protein n=1 Tax=Caproiciproducens galactitolivorans TaxID=642589 RepID=A0ABT4BRH2_9FIRM|nr:ABC transporter permease [Caproiciproducens galactitolivorans]MCY1713492.1 ABC transporter permease [Caproiciproducens galactitolivorans]
MLKDYFKGIWQDRYILLSLVNKDLQLKYRRSALGVAWAILTPLGLVLIIGSVYSIIFGADPKVFIPALFAGLNPWLFINIAADGGTMSFIGAEGYLKQTTVNAQIFPVRVVMGGFINLLYSILAFFAVYLFLQPQLFGPKMLMMFPGLIIMFVFAVSLANISAVLNLNARDYQPLQSLILQGLFYVTPIIYEPSMLAAKGFAIVYQINPIYYILEVVRTPMLGRELPTWDVYVIAIAITVVLFFISVKLVMKTKKGIAFKL